MATLRSLDIVENGTVEVGRCLNIELDETRVHKTAIGVAGTDIVNLDQMNAALGTRINVPYTPQETGIKVLHDFNADAPNVVQLKLDNDQSQLLLTHSGGVSGWDSVTSSTTESINDMAGDGTNIVCACNNGDLIISHDNGATFAVTTVDVGGNDMRAVVYIAGVGFIAAGANAQFHKSTDGGFNWVDNSPASAHDCNSLAYSATQIVGAGSSGRIFISDDDGDNWVVFWQGVAGTGTTFHKIVYNLDAALPSGEQYVVCGDNGGSGDAYIMTAFDPNSWTSRASNTTSTQRGLVWVNGKYLSCGDSGSIRTSTDGQAAWTTVTTAFSDLLHEITFTMNAYWTVGAGGASYTSPTGASSSFVSAPIGSPVITTDLFNIGTTNTKLYAMGASGVLEVNVSDPVFLSFDRTTQHAGTVYNTQPSNINPGCNKVEVFNEDNYFSALGTLDANLTYSDVNDSDRLWFDIFYQFGVAPSPTVWHVELNLTSKGNAACGGVHITGVITPSTVGSA